MVAGIIFVLAVATLFAFGFSTPDLQDPQLILNNYVDYVTQTDMNHFMTKSRYIYAENNATHKDYLVHQKIGYLVDNGRTEEAESFIENITNAIVPTALGVQYSYNDNIIFTQSGSQRPLLNISLPIATFYLDDTGIMQGPFVTRIAVWS